MSKLQDRVKAARRLRGLTQGELAEKIDLSTPSVSAIEIGRTSPTETIEKISKVLKVDYNWLLTGEGETPKGIKLTVSETPENPWQDETYLRMKEEIVFYRGIIEKLVGVVPNFPKSPNYASTVMRAIRGGVQLGDQLSKVA